jgi:RNA polymerase sigma-70 factor (ECF subfamily)
MKTGDGMLDRLVRLAEGARSGGRPEMEALLAASAGLAHAVARAKLGDTVDAEEAAVTALARVAQRLGQLGDTATYPRWLARIAERCAIDEARSRRRLPGPIRGEPPDRADGPAAVAAAAEEAARVRRAMAAMAPRLRAPLLLSVVEGLPYREIARLLGTGLATVSRRIERALSVLRRDVGGEP